MDPGRKKKRTDWVGVGGHPAACHTLFYSGDPLGFSFFSDRFPITLGVGDPTSKINLTKSKKRIHFDVHFGCKSSV